MEIDKPGNTWRKQCVLQYSAGLHFLNFLYTSLLLLLRGLRLMCGFLTRRNASDFFFSVKKSPSNLQVMDSLDLTQQSNVIIAPKS